MIAGMSDLFKGADPSTIGNSAQNVIAAANAAVAPNGYGQEKTVVKFIPAANGGWRTDDQNLQQEDDPLILTASLYAIPIPSNADPGGPIVGIALFGSGSGNTQVAEFDIPVIRSDGPLLISATQPQPFTGGVQISVPATSLEIRARNDANLIPLNSFTSTIGANEALDPAGSAVPIVVTGSIARGLKPTYARATRTVWLVKLPDGGATFSPGKAAIGFIPPFATSLRVARSTGVNFPSVAPGQITVHLLGSDDSLSDAIVVPAGTMCPEIPLSGQFKSFVVENTDAAATFKRIAGVFTLGI